MIQTYVPGFVFSIAVLSIAFALLLGTPVLLALLLVIVALVGYGLVATWRRMRLVELPQRQVMFGATLRQLLVVAAVGLLLGSAAIYTPARPGFAVLLLLALLVAAGLGMLVRSIATG